MKKRFIHILLLLGFVFNISLSFSQTYVQKIDEYKQTIQSLNKETNKAEIGGYHVKIAFLYWENEKHKLAIDHFLLALDLNNAIGNENAVGIIYKQIAFIYSESGDYTNARIYFSNSLKFNQNKNNKLGIAEDYINLAQVDLELKKYNEAVSFAEQSIALYKEMDNKQGLRKAYALMAELYEKAGNTEKSFEYFNLYSTIDKYLQKEFQKKKEEENKRQITEIQKKTSDEIRKKEEAVVQLDSSLQLVVKENVIKDSTITQLSIQKQLDELKKKEQEEEIKRAAAIRKYLIMTLISIFIAVVVLIRSNRIKKRTNIELEKQYKEILRQQKIIEEKNQHIEKGINYAKRIQKALLPQQVAFKNYFKDSFIYFRPKEIVSGDFYWFSDANLHTVIDLLSEQSFNPDQNLLNNKQADVIVGAIDCTGHGVPGAFMSMIGFTMINEIVGRGINKCDEVLNLLHQGVRNALKQDKTDNRDGMDIALCSVKKKEKVLEFSGARNPLIYIQNNELHEIKGDRFSIGGLQREEVDRKFNLHQIKIDKPSYFFIFSDGYQDQIGGEKGKKFMGKRFRELLLSIYNLPEEEKVRKLDEAIDEWRGKDYPQVDDILIIGFGLNEHDF